MSFEVSFLFNEQLNAKNLKHSLIFWNQKGHPSMAMTSTSKLERLLEDVLKLHFQNKSRALMDRIFDYRGPAGNFSSKIDLAYALGLVSQHTYKVLHVLRAIRNDIAHSEEELSFAAEQLDKHFIKLPITSDRELSFLQAVVDCMKDVKEKIEPLQLAQALKDYPVKR